VSGLRIATVYSDESFRDPRPSRMSILRWLRMSESLARLGHHVDMIVKTPEGVVQRDERLRFVHVSKVRSHDYDVVKVSYQRGFAGLPSLGLNEHPFLLSRLANVVGEGEHWPGVHYTGRERELLYELQRRIQEQARLVAVGTEAERRLWLELFQPSGPVVVVPTGVDREIPAPRKNPYSGWSERVALFTGNLRGMYREYPSGGAPVRVVGEQRVNELWQARLNSLGRLLKTKGIELVVAGPGQTGSLEADALTYVGALDSEAIWDHLHFAAVGIALAFGPQQIFECSKIYNYLRAGLPVVSEAPIPNNELIRATGLGLICDFGDDLMLAEMVEDAVERAWDGRAAVRHMVETHTWDKRAAIYDHLLRRELA